MYLITIDVKKICLTILFNILKLIFFYAHLKRLIASVHLSNKTIVFFCYPLNNISREGICFFILFVCYTIKKYCVYYYVIFVFIHVFKNIDKSEKQQRIVTIHESFDLLCIFYDS